MDINTFCVNQSVKYSIKAARVKYSVVVQSSVVTHLSLVRPGKSFANMLPMWRNVEMHKLKGFCCMLQFFPL